MYFADNPSCDQTCNLNHTQWLCVIHLDEDGIVFVLLGSLVEIRRKKLPGIIFYFCYPTIVGYPVDMNIKYRHKNADFHGLPAKKGAVVHDVRQNNFSVRGGYHKALFIGNNPVRISKKSANTKCYYQSNQSECRKSQ